MAGGEEMENGEEEDERRTPTPVLPRDLSVTESDLDAALALLQVFRAQIDQLTEDVADLRASARLWADWYDRALERSRAAERRLSECGRETEVSSGAAELKSRLESSIFIASD
jgi:hypothetical protein